MRKIGECASKPAATSPEGEERRYWFPFMVTNVKVSYLERCSAQQYDSDLAGALTELLTLGVLVDEHIDLKSGSLFGACSIGEFSIVIHSITDEASIRASKDIEKVVSSGNNGTGNCTVLIEEKIGSRQARVRAS